MADFSFASKIPSSSQDLFQYHSNPGALNRLIPPWEKISIERRSDSLAVGSEVVIKNVLFGVSVKWRAQHTLLDAPNSFQDIQLSGPFKTWVHDHIFQSNGVNSSELMDRVRYETKFGLIGRIGLPIVQRKLSAMFAYRHRTTRADLILQSFLRQFTSDRILRIGVTGSTGLIGRRLVDLISVLGHQAIRILRKSSVDQVADFPTSSKSVVWDVGKGFSDNAVMQGVDAVVHLAGKGIASMRWTDSVKQSIRESRVQGTRALVQDLCRLDAPPRAFVCASGVGIYGDQGGTILDERAEPSNDFLADLARDWEEAANEFGSSRGRVAIGRLGMALHPRQGALSKLLVPFQFGLGGPIGNGRQFWSWIHVDDAAAAFLYLAANSNSVGAYNLVAPEQVNNQAFSKILACVLHRPSFLPTPAIALRALLGEMADAMLLASTRAECKRLIEEGFPFRSTNLEDCLRHVLGLECY